MKLATFAFFVLWTLHAANGFANLPKNSNRRALVTRQHVHGERMQDVEQARAKLENLFWSDYKELQVQEDALTSTSIHRRQLEIELLKSLEDSDAALEELVHLWLYQHGGEAATALEDMSGECSPGLFHERAVLEAITRDYPSWAEPQMRLGALLYYKGETAHARQMALGTLKLKPWHFEAYQLMILLALQDGDMGKALVWARRSLPSLRSKRRASWVRRAVAAAEDQLKELLGTTKSEDEGKEDEEIDYGDAWQ